MAPVELTIETDAFAYWPLSRERGRPSEAERTFADWRREQFRHDADVAGMRSS